MSDPDAALWKLAERLHWKMEHLMPSGDDWSIMDKEEREFYYLCVKAVLQQRLDVCLALGIVEPSNE